MSDKNLELFLTKSLLRRKIGDPEGGIIFVTQNNFIKRILTSKEADTYLTHIKLGARWIFHMRKK